MRYTSTIELENNNLLEGDEVTFKVNLSIDDAYVGGQTHLVLEKLLTQGESPSTGSRH